MDTVIVGGGAAGMAAAIAAAMRGQRVTVLERNRKPLKKLGVTGNGRANLLNSGAPRYYGDAAFAEQVLTQVGFDALTDFFAELGVPLRSESEGRVYPAALLASVAVDALLLRARQLNIDIRTGATVTRIARRGDRFAVEGLAARDAGEATPARGKTAKPAQDLPAPEPFALQADRVIVTVGGAAAPAHGTDGSAYGLLTAFGHKLIPVKPALCALLTEPKGIRGLSGQRLKARVSLHAKGGALLHAAEGEILFGDDAVSGIAAMQLARFYAPGATLRLDASAATGWVADADGEDSDATVTGKPAPGGAGHDRGAFIPTEGGENRDIILAQLRRLQALRMDCPLGELFTGVVTPAVARLWRVQAGFGDPTVPVSALRDGDLQRLAATLGDIRLPITGTRGFSQAQVTAGGIATAEFDPATLQSKLCKGLYAAGEVLNVDGDCGGFNLMFAFASGLIAGRQGKASAVGGEQ